MNIDSILQQLREQRGRLDAAITALEGVGGSTGKRRGRPPGSAKKAAPKKRSMSPAARKRIAEAMRKRWAAAKRSGKKRL